LYEFDIFVSLSLYIYLLPDNYDSIQIKENKTKQSTQNKNQIQHGDKQQTERNKKWKQTTSTKLDKMRKTTYISKQKQTEENINEYIEIRCIEWNKFYSNNLQIECRKSILKPKFLMLNFCFHTF
jgi:hypothetical protein